jgi:hypothetical protein
MADSTSNIPQISQSQSQKEVLANALFDTTSPSIIFGRNSLTSAGLTWGFLGGRIYLNGNPTVIANGTITLAANQTNFVEVNQSGVVSSNTSGFSADRAPLYRVVTGASTVTSYEDHRSQTLFDRLFYGRTTLNVGPAATTTLTLAQSLAHSIGFTGALPSNRTVIFPTVTRNYLLFANTTGGQTITVRTAAGTGVTLTDGQRRIVECDGVNIVAFT